jgi:hypothetical protein
MGGDQIIHDTEEQKMKIAMMKHIKEKERVQGM